MAEIPEILQVDHVTRHFDGMDILQDISFGIVRGTCVGLVGDNGSGKTSLLNILSGIDRPDAGHIRFKVKNGEFEDITSWPAWHRGREGIHYYFQAPRIWRNLTVREHIEVALSNRGKNGSLLATLHHFFSHSLRKEDWNRCEEILDFVGLEGCESHYAGKLSYGQAKLLNLAQLLACPHRQLFLLDEPSAGLSPAMSRKMVALLRRVKLEGLSMLVVEHNSELMEDIADVVLQLEHGRMRQVEGNGG
jgi:ABC-type branched-subunit amino acid transport system ATPase component